MRVHVMAAAVSRSPDSPPLRAPFFASARELARTRIVVRKSERDGSMFLNRPLAAAIAILAAGLAVSAAAAQSGASVITCTNPASGASWQISIDYDKATVDSNPARISDTKISWHSAK